MPDKKEVLDNDGDGVPDHKDLDDDNDGIPDKIDKDANGDGINDDEKIPEDG